MRRVTSVSKNARQRTNKKRRWKGSSKHAIEMAIKPVEIEFLMRDKLSPGMDKAGKSADTLADRVDKASKSITDRIKEQREEVNRVEKDLQQLERQLKKAVPGKEWAEMKAEVDACSKALKEEKVTLSALEAEHKKNEGSAKKLTTELRQLQNALAQMRLDGKQGTAAYQEMSERAALLRDTLGDLRTQTNILANDNAGLQGVISGVNGLSGAFTVATGLMGAFASENEDLIKIQTRVQSVMAVTMGLQQIANTLNKDSAFRIVTVRKAKELLTAANYKLAASLGISNAAAKALMATLTLGLSVAVTAAIVAIDKFNERKAQAREEAEKAVSAEKDARAEMVKTQATIRETMRAIRDFNGSKRQESAMVEELNRKHGEAFGYYDTLAQWYEILAQKGEQYIKILFLQAKAQSLINKAVEADEKIAKIEAAPESDYDTWWGYGGKVDRFFSRDKRYKQNNNGKWLKEEAKEAAKAVKQAYLDEAEQLQKEAGDIMSKFDLGGYIAPQKKNGGEGAGRYLSTLFDAEKRARHKIEAQRIALMKEGYEKERATARGEFARELERIEEEAQQRLALYEKLREAGAKVAPHRKIVIQAQASEARVLAASLRDSALAAIDKKEREENKKALDELLAKYRNYAEQRKAVWRNYNEELRRLTSQMGVENVGQIMSALAELKKQTDKSIRDIRDAEIEETEKNSSALVELFADASERSVAEIKKIITQSEALYRYLRETNADEITAKFGMSAGKLRKIKETPQELEAIRQAIERLKNEVAGQSPLDKFALDIKKALDLIKKGSAANIGKGVTQIGAAVNAALPAVQEFGDLLSSAIGDDDMADEINTAVAALGHMATTATGVGQIISGDIVGGIQNVASGVLNLFSMATAAEKRHQEALRQIEAAQREFENQYNLLKIRQALLAKDAETVFGVNRISQAIAAVKAYRDAMEELHRLMKGDAPALTFWGGITSVYQQQLAAYNKGVGGLYNAMIKTGHKKTGLFGWGKGKDIYDSILSVYPELIKANGELDTELLKIILDTREMDEETRKYLRSLLEAKDLMQQAEEALSNYLKETFGSLGDSMMQSIIAAIKDGSNAIENFAKEAGKVFENLGTQLAYSLFFADQFQYLQKKLKEIYSLDKPEEEIANIAGQFIDEFINGMSGPMGAAQEFLEEWKKKWAGHGYDLWNNEGGQTGKAGAFTTMTQDQATKLEGMFTAGQVHWANIDENIASFVDIFSGMLNAINQIVNNTRHIPDIYDDIQEIKRDGIKIR
ncbi:TPA_asm: tail tape measure [Porphyromonas phage phage013a_WW2885]|uniref:Tail tape measure n=2 Tax=root TaxID=1 RepID=A0AAT9JKK4_9CAUD